MNNHLPTAQLWLGSYDHLEKNAIQFLQKQLCTQNACNTCTMCTHIQQKQHHALLWIEPEKQYTLQSLEPLQKTIAYSLQDNDIFFFVLHKADLLTPACQNSLLKTIEEPPPGYHFILLATGLQEILPTIQSRCMIKHLTTVANQNTHPLFTFFTGTQQDPARLLQLLDQVKPTERETIALINQFLKYWLEQYAYHAQTPTSSAFIIARKRVTFFERALLAPPMPGGAKLFWKNVYLHTR